MDIELTIKVTGLVLESLTYIGISPLKWNPLTQQAIPISSRREKLRWHLICVPFSLLELGITLNFILEKISTPFNPAISLDIWQLIMTSVYIATSSFHWRCYKGRYELAILINETHLYFKTFSARHNKNGDHCWKEKLAPFITITQLILLMILAFGTVLLFILRCDYHYAAQLLPVCKMGVAHYSFAWSFLMGIPHVIIGCHCVSGVFISTAIGATLILGGSNVLDKIKAMKDLEFTNSSVQRYRFWSRHYRSWQILISQFNVFFGSLLPIIFFFLMSLHIIMLDAFIMFGQEGITQCLNASMQLMIAGYYYFIPHMSFKLCDTPREILESEKENCGKISKLYKSFPPLRIKVGGFGYIHRLTLPTMLETVFVNTINIILLDPKVSADNW